MDITPPSSPPPRRGNHSVSRSSTPSSLTSNHPPFHISSRARVVSGITTEQAQAPKNYVDFDDEPEKLKDMLKSGVRETSVTDRLMPSFDKGFSFEKSGTTSTSSPTATRTVTRRESRSLLSATQSPTLTSKSFSVPPSPALLPSSVPDMHALSLGQHVLPPRFGDGYAVTGIKSLHGGHQLLCLQRKGEVFVLSTDDGACHLSMNIGKSDLLPPTGMLDHEHPDDAWLWTRLEIVEMEETIYAMACAEPDENLVSQINVDSFSEIHEQRHARVVLLSLKKGAGCEDEEILMEKIGDWCVNGSVEGIAVFFDADGSLKFIHMNQERHVLIQSIHLTAPMGHNPHDEVLSHELLPANLAALPFNPFKTKQAFKAKAAASGTGRISGRVEVSDETDLGELSTQSGFKGLRVVVSGDCIRAMMWSDTEFMAFDVNSTRTTQLFAFPSDGVRIIKWFDKDVFSAVYPDRVDSFRITLLDANGDELPSSTALGILQSPQLVESILIREPQASFIISPAQVLSTGISLKGRRKLILCKGADPSRKGSVTTGITLWKALHSDRGALAAAKNVTCSLPLELNLIILGYSDGTLGRSSFRQLAHQDAPVDVSDVPLNGFITSLHRVYSYRTSQPLLVGGSDDGSVAIWSSESLKLLARWTVFVAPLVEVVQPRQERGAPFSGCILCVSADGTIAVVALDDQQLLYLVPGSRAPLVRLCTKDDNLLLAYADERARLWDVRTQVFWRSMSIEKAEEMLNTGSWFDVHFEGGRNTPPHGEVGPLAPTAFCADAAVTVLVDLEAYLTRAVSIAKSHTDAEKTHGADSPEGIAATLRSILGALITPGLNLDIDYLCREKLGIEHMSAWTGLYSNRSASIINCDSSRAAWSVSYEVSALRALALVSCLRALSHLENVTEETGTAIAFYSTALALAVGNSYRPPSLSFLARWWFESSVEIRAAARTLFDAGVANMTTEETMSLVEQWQHHLPCLQPDAERKSSTVAMALFLCGHIAADRFNLLSTSSLNDISKSIVLYLHDEDAPYKLLAIDLCSRGFNIWQQYVDAMEMLRSLISLATASTKDHITAHNVGPQARLAVMHIVTANTPLFMTTLSLDILHPRNMEHRKSIMQIMAFLIRKKPLVIYPNLPRLIEAVVKSLDPNSTSDRDAVLDTATEILGHVVKTFPTVDFHMNSQRLAVGTSEGAVIMYDLKTATRLYVLECHKKRPTACSFSPDGRRLVTVSLEEGLVLVWKVGSSFTSFFNPGAPPRQGHSGSEPYKSLTFPIGDEAHMSIEETLQAVRFEWVADRSVRLKVGGLTMTFST
ncbi:hypothetical protein EVG20_g5003 [Dentipellis fragilis]|uniref:Uncharacterized protein n=1 Tax=Dentipellis fragilis TaxID=205917 RepID=A0A4Y9YWF8_9AGAM|nr:hypothetical protein EVG20_g5003 [Dentipellis fragilis]